MNKTAPLKSPVLLVPIALVVLVAGWFGYKWYAGIQEQAAERQKLLADLDTELAKEPIDGSELTLLLTRIHRLPDHESANDLLAAQARIELARGRPEKAADLFLPVASRPGAAPAEQALGALILLRRHEAGAADRPAATLLLEQALAMAENAYAASADVADVMHAWLAAMRLSNKEQNEKFAARILAAHEDSAAARFVQLCRSWQPTTARDAIDRVRAEFSPPPAELDAMLAVSELAAGNVQAAIAAAEAVLAKAPGVVEVRDAVGKVFHVCVLGSAEGAPERVTWVVRRDAQIDWLLAQAAPEDPRRAAWIAMRSQR